METKTSRLRPLLTSLGLALTMATLPACVIHVGSGGSHWGWHGIRGSGHRVEEVRDVPEFTRVAFDVAGDIVVKVGQDTSVTLSGDDNILPEITTRVDNGTLHIDLEGNYDFDAGLRVSITTPELRSFVVNGSADVEILDAKGDDLELAIHGSGDVFATGSVRALSASIAGSGDFDLNQLTAEEAQVSIEGSGDIRIKVAKQLDYSIEGSGSISYVGSPSVSGSISGSGRVREAH